MVECHDISHDTRCTASEPLTWLRARLCTSTHSSDVVVLNLEWTPHLRLDAVTITEDGRLLAAGLRTTFETPQGLGPADNTYPVICAGTRPEMLFFGPTSQFGCLASYETGEMCDLKPPSAQSPSLLPPHSRSSRLSYRWGRNGSNLTIEPHFPKRVLGKLSLRNVL